MLLLLWTNAAMRHVYRPFAAEAVGLYGYAVQNFQRLPEQCICTISKFQTFTETGMFDEMDEIGRVL